MGGSRLSLNTDKKINIAYYKYINKYLENIALFHFFSFIYVDVYLFFGLKLPKATFFSSISVRQN